MEDTDTSVVMNRRCPECNPCTDWLAHITWCPDHIRKQVGDHPKPMCDTPGCGKHAVENQRACTGCGEPNKFWYGYRKPESDK